MPPFLIVVVVGIHVATCCFLPAASWTASAAFGPAPVFHHQHGGLHHHHYGSFSSTSSPSESSSFPSKGHRPHTIYDGLNINRRTTLSSSLTTSMAFLSPTATAATTTTVALAIGHVLGGIAAVPWVVQATRTWYRKIALPSWTPPDRVFGPDWTVLYACMGIALARVLQRLPGGVPLWKSPAVGFWILHYALNLCWAPIFFGAKRLRLGLWINYLLLATLGAGVIPRFAAVHVPSALLLVPYAVWLLYATVLNQAICQRNPTDVYGYNAAKFEDGLIRLQEKAAIYAGVN